MKESANNKRETESGEKKKRKIPGMLYILFSFIPWMVYWTSSGMGNVMGILIALAITVILLIPQIRKMDFNLMDITSIIFFITAAVASFIFNTKIFVENSGLLGYTALFVMALFSVLIRKPFTLQVSKRDYPKVYWKDESFIAVNSLITIVWVVIFLLDALIFWGLSNPYSTIIGNILVVAGIVFSIIFPMKAPAYFVTREFKKFDWRVPVDPLKPKGEDEYDVIIVGSGLGGLSCGALLSRWDYKVLVLEQHFRTGGYCSSFKRDGFVFNTGVEDVSGLWGKGPLNYLLNTLELDKEDFFVKNTMRYIFQGDFIEASNMDQFRNLLKERFPGEDKNIKAFFEDAAQAYEESYLEAEKYGSPLPPFLLAKAFGDDKLLKFPMEHPHFFTWLEKSYQQKLDEYFENDDIKTFLSALLGYLGTEPDKTPAAGALTACVSYYLHGGYFTRGGAQKFADSFKEFIGNHGGQVLLKNRVDQILADSKQVKGVKVGDKIFKAPVVVSNANAKTTFLELVDREELDKEFLEYIEGLKMSSSCFMTFLGVDMDLSSSPSIILDLDDDYGVVVNSSADPSLAPEGQSSITILTGANYHDFPERNTDEYQEIKDGMADDMIQKVEKLFPGISEKIIVRDAATPKTFERYTSMPEGALYSFDQSMGVKRPFFKTPLKGLYLASASTFPGGGIEAVVISGIIAANDITEWKVK